MAKTFRLAATQVHYGWSDKATPVNPYGDQFDPAALPAHIKSNTDKQLALFEQAGANDADLVVSAEDMQRLGHFGGFLEDQSHFLKLVEPIPGPTSKRISAIARKHRMYIVACYPEKAGGKFYNTGVLFDRAGRIRGKYRKVQLPANEGLVFSPGNKFPVFKTELGNIGIAVCYDMYFPEVPRCLALGGADIIAHPTMGYGVTESGGEAVIKARAIDNGVTIIVSCSKRSQVVNPAGEIMCDAGHRQDVVVFADYDTLTPRLSPEKSYATVGTGIRDIRERWTKERMAKCFKLIASENPPLLKRYSKKMPPRTRKEKLAVYRITSAEHRRVCRGEPPTLSW